MLVHKKFKSLSTRGAVNVRMIVDSVTNNCIFLPIGKGRWVWCGTFYLGNNDVYYETISMNFLEFMKNV